MRLRGTITWFKAWESLPLDETARSPTTKLFKLSTSDAEDDGDSPDDKDKVNVHKYGMESIKTPQKKINQNSEGKISY